MVSILKVSCEVYRHVHRKGIRWSSSDGFLFDLKRFTSIEGTAKSCRYFWVERRDHNTVTQWFPHRVLFTILVGAKNQYFFQYIIEM